MSPDYLLEWHAATQRLKPVVLVWLNTYASCRSLNVELWIIGGTLLSLCQFQRRRGSNGEEGKEGKREGNGSNVKGPTPFG